MIQQPNVNGKKSESESCPVAENIAKNMMEHPNQWWIEDYYDGQMILGNDSLHITMVNCSVIAGIPSQICLTYYTIDSIALKKHLRKHDLRGGLPYKDDESITFSPDESTPILEAIERRKRIEKIKNDILWDKEQKIKKEKESKLKCKLFSIFNK